MGSKSWKDSYPDRHDHQKAEIIKPGYYSLVITLGAVRIFLKETICRLKPLSVSLLCAIRFLGIIVPGEGNSSRALWLGSSYITAKSLSESHRFWDAHRCTET